MLLSTDEVRVLLVQAKSGKYPKAAQQLMAHFVDRMTDGGDFDRKILDEYILHAFERILGCNGVKPTTADQAFGLKAKTGRPKTTEERDMQIAAYVEYLTKYSGLSWEDACAVAAEFFLDADKERTAQEAHKKHIEAIRMWTECSKETLLSALPEELQQKMYPTLPAQ